ncbi:MAG: thioredoxin domain-containing protein [Rubripirellula sp.]
MNRLATSLSPYLLQHKGNPVDWYPRGAEAFEAAIRDDKPIFLSVGYAACHWCHVMEHESFENVAIASMLNDHFVSIKVDREERPDIDQVYMNAVQLMTGRGGWPMSVFLDHQRRPFFAGTYWPPVQKFGMPGFAQVLEALTEAWKNRRDEVGKHSGEITASLQQLAIGSSPSDVPLPVPDAALAASSSARLLGVLDREWGGFGAAPKFPHATDLELLLRVGTTQHNEALIEAVELTLDRMAEGGIRDHIGGGFARYSVDAKWLVPHFEKMLYDNALLAEVYTRTYQATGNQRHAAVARETLDYICRELLDPAGGFHCSEDADSEGVEGKFYVWTPEEVAQILGTEAAETFCTIYGITERGNFEGKNIPHLPGKIESHAEALALDVAELSASLSDQREQLRIARDARVHPGRDDKILTSWNALAIKALATGGGVFNEPTYLDAAERASQFLVEKMTRDDGRLLHAYRDGQSHLDGYVDDYAYTIEAFITLYEANGNARWIANAVKLAEAMLAHFEDRENGGFFYTADDAETLIARNKDWHDGSLVSGNAAAAMGLLRLSRLCDREDFRLAAERTLIAGSEVVTTQSAACAALLSALDRYWHDQEQLVMAVADEESLAMMRSAFLASYRPHCTLSWVIGDAPQSEFVIALNRDRTPLDGEPTLYQCSHFSCAQPIQGATLAEWLESQSSGGKV